MGASTVIFTIFLLDLHFRDVNEPVPLSTQRFFKYFIGKIACYPSCYVCIRSKPTQVEPRKYSNSIRDKKGLPPDMTEVSPAENADEYTWKDIVIMLDRFYLRLYLIIISILTIAMVAVMAGN